MQESDGGLAHVQWQDIHQEWKRRMWAGGGALVMMIAASGSIVPLYASGMSQVRTHVSAGVVEGARSHDFLIPAGPLDEALRRYGDVTGMAVLVDGVLLAGRRAAPVEGRFTARQALDQLLAGSGLTPRYTGDDAFTLEVAEHAVPGRQGPGVEVDAASHARLVRIQQTVESTLCASALARPGTYRAAVQLWFDDRGSVERSLLLDTTGSADRDEAVESALAGLRLDDPEFAEMSPVTLLVLPEQPGLTLPCQAGGSLH